MDGDVMAVAATRESVYVVGHYDHTVPDPKDPCLEIRDLGDGHSGVRCPDGTPSRHLAAFYGGAGTVGLRSRRPIVLVGLVAPGAVAERLATAGAFQSARD